MKLENGNWLNDNLFNSYLNFIAKKNPKIGYLSTNAINHFKRNQKLLYKWNFEIKDIEKILCPIFIPGHWAIGIFDLRQKTKGILDSIECKSVNNAFEKIK